MNSGNGMLLVIIGLVILWAVISGGGPCFGGFVNCLATSGKKP